MPTLLRYDLTTDPFPLQAGAESANQQATLTVVASNPNPDPAKNSVKLQGIIIAIPVGADGKDLVAAANGITPIPPPGWKEPTSQTQNDYVEYTFHPEDGTAEVGFAGVSFVFNLETNSQPGTVEIVVTEGSNDCEPPGCPQQSFYLTKFPTAWAEVLFWADEPVIEAGNAVTLHWAGPPLADYTIAYYTPEAGSVQTIPKKGDPALSNQGQYPSATDPPLQLERDTTFYLTVERTFDDRKHKTQQQILVTVEVTLPQIKLLTGEVMAPFGSSSEPVSLVLKWDTQNATTCRVTGDAHLLTPSSLDDSYQIVPSVKRPLQHTYMMTAENAVGVTQPPALTVEWGQAIASVTDGGGVVVLSDDPYVYIAGGPSGTLVKFELASLLNGSPAPAAQYVADGPSGGNFGPDSPFSAPNGLALSADNSLLYVTDQNGGIFVLDPGTLKQINANVPGFYPTAIACPRDASKVYVANSQYFEGIVMFVRSSRPGSLNFDDSNPKRPYSPAPNIMTLSPSDGRVFAGHNGGDFLTIWEPTNDQYGLAQVGVIEAVQFIPRGIAFSPDGTRIFVVGDGNQLHVFDYATLQPAGNPVALNLNPIAIASTADGTRLLVSDGQTLSVIVPSGVSGGVGG